MKWCHRAQHVPATATVGTGHGDWVRARSPQRREGVLQGTKRRREALPPAEMNTVPRAAEGKS